MTSPLLVVVLALSAALAVAAPTSAAPAPVVTVVADSAPSFTVADPPTTATAGTAYTASFTAAGNPAPTYQLVADPPSFLTIDPDTGQVSGTPTRTGTFTYAVRATNTAGQATTSTYTVTATAAPWQASVRGFVRPAPRSAKGYYLGVVRDRWKLAVIQPTRVPTVYSGTITLNRGSFRFIQEKRLEADDTVSIDGRSLTFSFTSSGDIDALSFVTSYPASTMSLTLSIDGTPATGNQVFIGNPATPSPTPSPLTYRRVPGS